MTSTQHHTIALHLLLLQPIVLQGGVEIIDSGSGGGGGMLTGILVGVVLVVVGVGVFLFVRWSQAQHSGGPMSIRSLPRNTRKELDVALRAEEFGRAADILSRAGLHTDAADHYVKAGAHVKAARSYMAAENRALAIKHFKTAGEYAQAARLYAEDGDHRAAAAEYVQAKDFVQAAEEYMRGGDHRRAAENFEKGKKLERAAEAFEKAGEPEQAARCFEEHIKLRTEGKGFEALGDEDRGLARKTAELFKAAGQIDRAVELFRMAGLLDEAAAALSSSGEFARAAELLLEAGKPMAAARLFEESGDVQRASLMRAEQAIKDGRMAVAAEELRSAGELSRAAAIFEDLGRWDEAAQLFEEGGAFERACELYKRAGRFAHAGRCAEALEQLPLAAELFEQANDTEALIRVLKDMGDFYRAGRILFEHRQYMEALKVLDLIEADSPIYAQSQELQGDVFTTQGRHEKAYSRYKTALGKRRPQTTTINLYYKMARALEEVSDTAGAAQLYEAVVEVDAEHEDATSRLRALKGGRRQTQQVKTSGLFKANSLEEGSRRYEIIEEAARGGMGVVYRARDTVLGRIVAFKLLGENLRDNETAVKYFLREARAAAALSHPNIVTIYDAGEQDGEFYMAMEFIEGTTLKELIRRVGAMPDDQVRYIIHHCCAALHYAHSKGVIHRDIKSGNVMITRDRTLKVMDFGLAKFLREYQKDHTQQVGTPFYMSPEQIIGRDVDFRSDLYSLGCMAFECATGVVPFREGDLTYHHLHTEPPTPTSINPNVSPQLEEIILTLLQKKPDDRYQSARHVMRAVALQMA